MDFYKQQLAVEGRQQRSSQVEIQIYQINEITKVIKAVVLKEDKRSKYFLTVDLYNSIKDECGCQDFYHNNTENYKSCVGDSFKCKHLLKLRQVLGGNL